MTINFPSPVSYRIWYTSYMEWYRRLTRNKDEQRIIWTPCSRLYPIFKGANSLELSEEVVNSSTCDIQEQIRRLELACTSGSPSFIDETSPPRMMTTRDSSLTTLLRETTCEKYSGTSRFVDDTSFATSSAGATCGDSEFMSYPWPRALEWRTHIFYFI
jgi:hypothetical protein